MTNKEYKANIRGVEMNTANLASVWSLKMTKWWLAAFAPSEVSIVEHPLSGYTATDAFTGVSHTAKTPKEALRGIGLIVLGKNPYVSGLRGRIQEGAEKARRA